jgi:type IV secretion system protein VirD4
MRTSSHRNEAIGDFGHAPKAPSALAHVLFAIVCFAGLQATGWQVTTQWLARRLEHQAALGPPLFELGIVRAYAPWRHRQWRAQLREVHRGAAIARAAGRLSELSTFLAVVLSVAATGRRARQSRNRINQLHGSAAWATRADVERAGLFAGEGVVVGHWMDGRKLRVLRHDGPEGVLCFAPPRSGKGIGPVQSTLLTWRHSALVLDPKGENYAYTSGWRASLGQRVYCLNFSATPGETAAFNPLDSVRVSTEHEVADAQRLAQMLVDPDGKQADGQNAHWAETSTALLTGAILHALYRHRERVLRASLRDVADELSDPMRTHAEVLMDWLNFQHSATAVSGWVGTHPVVAAAAREQLNREERERAAVLSSTVAKLALFRDPRVTANTARSSFAIEEIMDGNVPATIYLVISPADIQRLRPLVRLLVDVVMRRLVETMKFETSSTSAHKHRLLLMLDEFPMLGNMPVFTETFAYCAGYGIKTYLIAQDYEQIRATYGNRETISSSCNIWTAYAPNKLETAQLLAARLGKTTVLRRSRRQGRHGGVDEQEVGRDLKSADEVMRLQQARKRDGRVIAAGEMLIFAHGRPILGRQPLYFLDPITRNRRGMNPAPTCHEC